ncbi:RNA polymerase sigma factor [Streptomyces sp. NPDC021100]|uniref:RNA polymerase sigma factor n=1 Tax=Streptomyces sp. NPDC021100 TaxID=3365114 RepID=UPI0037990C5F
MGTDNAALVEAARTGDTAAQDELVAACLPLVYNIVGRALNGHADVDDVVQETMLRVINGWEGCATRPVSVPGWWRSPPTSSAPTGASAARRPPSTGSPGPVPTSPTRRPTSSPSPSSGSAWKASARRSPRPRAGWTRESARCSPCGGWRPRGN